MKDRKQLLTRLGRLEAAARARTSGRPAEVLFLDLEGDILDDGTPAMREWAGRPVGDWPAEWLDRPHPVKVVMGVDPLVLFGLAEGPPGVAAAPARVEPSR